MKRKKCVKFNASYESTSRKQRLSHPGQFIRMEVIEPLGLSVTQAAKVLGVSRPALSALHNGRAALSPDMALRIEKAFDPKMDTLLRMQTACRLPRPATGRQRSRLSVTWRCPPAPTTRLGFEYRQHWGNGFTCWDFRAV